MAKRTYQASLQFLVVSFIVQPVVFQTVDTLSLKNVGVSSTDIPSTLTPHEAKKTTIFKNHGMITGSSQEEENKMRLDNANTNIPTIGNTTNVPSLFSTLAHSSHTETHRPSEITSETTTEVTVFSTESFVSNSTYQNPGNDSKATTSVITKMETAPSSATSSLSSSKVSHSVSTSQLPVAGPRMKNPEFILTVVFALILTLTIVGLLVYILNKYRMQKAQYSHHQLHDTTFDTVDRYATPDDTLVISGGLYDAPRIYNSSMTAYEDEGFPTDYLPFSTQHGQFRLEFFGEKEKGISLTSETLEASPGSL